MRLSDIPLDQMLREELANFETYKPLPGIAAEMARSAFILQLIDSMRRVRFVETVSCRPIAANRGNPKSELFDPLRAALLHRDSGNIEEAFWLAFLAIYFGKSARTGWRLCRDMYGSLGADPWTWERISADPTKFREWLAVHIETLKHDGNKRHFGNHRKRENFLPESQRGTAAAFESYVEWIGGGASQQTKIEKSVASAGGAGRPLFRFLYANMHVVSFGRTGRFDFLTMLGKLGLADIEADSAYIWGSTGPLAGARLLFGGDSAARIGGHTLDNWVAELEAAIPLGRQSFQVLEDAICNWQKHPTQFKRFQG